MSDHEIDKILQRYLRDECNDDEKRWVEEWFEAIGKNSGELDTQTQLTVKKRLWSKLKSDISEYSYSKISRIAASLLILMVSASLLIMYFRLDDEGITASATDADKVHVINLGDVPKRIELKDGTIVSLQPGGEVSYPEVFDDKREVFLSGEAFFEVAKDASKPFLVYTNEVTTKVLGTSFLIKAYQQEKEIVVSVKTGKVSVYTQPSKNNEELQREIVLTPNQQVIYNRNENLTVKKLVDEPQVVVQQPSKKTTYTDAPVIEILQALEERYGVDIQYDANVLSGCTLMSADITEEGLYEQIEIICHAIGARYKPSEFSILIDAEGCK
jgi:transmembrane sensor